MLATDQKKANEVINNWVETRDLSGIISAGSKQVLATYICAALERERIDLTNQFEEQLSLRDKRDEDMQEIMRINNDLVSHKGYLMGVIDELTIARDAATEERDDALENLEQAERNQEMIAEQFEGDCTKALVRLINEFDFEWDYDGVTADQAEQFILDVVRDEVRIAEERGAEARKFRRALIMLTAGVLNDMTVANTPHEWGEGSGLDYAQKALGASTKEQLYRTINKEMVLG